MSKFTQGFQFFSFCLLIKNGNSGGHGMHDESSGNSLFNSKNNTLQAKLNGCIKYCTTPVQARIQELLVEGDDVDEEKLGRGLGTAVGPQRGSGAEPLVGVRGEAPYDGNAFFINFTVILHFLNSAIC
jgi:hypothetical protein